MTIETEGPSLLTKAVAFPLYGIKDGPNGPKCACSDPECPPKRWGKHTWLKWGGLIAGDRIAGTEGEHNLAYATGSRSGFFVLDVDGAEGETTLAALGGVPETYTVRTPTSVHYYFRLPSFLVKTSGGEIGKGIDVRGEGGLIVAAGSRHRTGGWYEVAKDVEIAQAPAWLLAHPSLKKEEGTGAPMLEGEADLPKAWERSAETLASAWPSDADHDHKFALAGALSRTYSENACITFLVRTCELAGADASNAEKLVRDAFTGLRDGRTTWGWSELVNRMGEPAKRARAILEGTENAAEILSKMFGTKDAPASTTSATPDRKRDSILGIRTIDWSVPPAPISWLVEDVIVSATVVGLVAHGDSCKTWLAHSIALAVASGKPWLGKYTVKKGRVVILDFESGQHETHRRLRIVDRSPWAGVLGSGLPLTYAYPETNLSDEMLWTEIMDLKPDLVIIDSLNGGNGEADENKTEAAFPLKLAGKLAEGTGATCIVIHHAAKGNRDRREMVRGSSAIFAAFDTVYSVSYEHGGAAKMFVSKPGPMRAGAPIHVRLATDDSGIFLVEDSKPSFAKTQTDTPEGLRAAVLLSISTAPGELTKAAVATNVGRRKADVSRAIDELVSKEEIKAIRGTYHLNKKSDQVARVKACLAAERFTSKALLAREAGVSVPFLTDMINQGTIGCGGDGSLFVVP